MYFISCMARLFLMFFIMSGPGVACTLQNLSLGMQPKEKKYVIPIPQTNTTTTFIIDNINCRLTVGEDKSGYSGDKVYEGTFNEHPVFIKICTMEEWKNHWNKISLSWRYFSQQYYWKQYDRL